MPDEQILQRALELAKSGKRNRAREILKEVINEDMDNVAAWVAMTQLASNRTEAVLCLKQVLRLAPDNPWAKAQMHRLTAKAPARTLSVPLESQAGDKVANDNLQATEPAADTLGPLEEMDFEFMKPGDAGGATLVTQRTQQIHQEDLLFGKLTDMSPGAQVSRGSQKLGAGYRFLKLVALAAVVIVVAIIIYFGVLPLIR